MPRLATGRGFKSHWNYSVAETARIAGVHRNAVRAWIKDGLPLATERRPFLIRGCDLIAYLDRRKKKRKRPLANGEIYCVACHDAKRPAGDMVDYEPASQQSGMLIGICPDCDRYMRRMVSAARLSEVAAGLELSIAGGCETLESLTNPPANSDLSEIEA